MKIGIPIEKVFDLWNQLNAVPEGN